MTPLLFEQFPRLAADVPFAPLMTGPTPVEPVSATDLGMDVASLWIKRDDQTRVPAGGNKIRKLEFILGEARARGVREIITFGFAGSNHCVATAECARSLGIGTTALLLPQRPAPYVAANLSRGLAAGATLIHRETEFGLGVALAARWVRGALRARLPYVVPAGGSSALGMLGFINAGLELAGQVRAGVLPPPDLIYVALGSGGTAIGVQVGLSLAGLNTQVVPVRVVARRYMNARTLAGRWRRLARYGERVGLPIPADASTITARVREDHFGEGYGVETTACAVARGCADAVMDVELDTAYAGKAFAACLMDGRDGRLRDRHVVFWNTFGGQVPDQSPPREDLGLQSRPAALRRYF